MQRKLSRKELLAETYLNKSQTSLLFGLSRIATNKAFDEAMRIEKEKEKFRIFDSKVKLSTLCKVTNISYAMLAKQIANA